MKKSNNMDSFEERLRNQPMRNVPTDWRKDILSAAHAAVTSKQLARDAKPSLLSTLIRQLRGALKPGEGGSALLWPSPKAWAGLATVWLVILVLNVSASDKTQSLAMQSPPPSPAMVKLLKEQRQELAELAGLAVPADVDKPKPDLPAPRSQLRDDWSLT
jgi:hypothetical protein